VDDDLFGNLYLEPEQEQLLADMVEAERKVPRASRRPFIFADSSEGGHLLHEGFRRQESVYRGDLMTLAERRLLRLDFGGRGTPNFDVTPEGRAYYEYMKRRAGEPAAQVTAEVRSYLDTDRFRSDFGSAFVLWAEAEATLWAADSMGAYTEIGHKCRESMREFTEVLLQRHPTASRDPNPANTVARLRSVIASASETSPKVEALADALIVYWGTVSDLAQRQEHGALKEGAELDWEDARRVVFHTGIVMFEIARLLGD
jgi:hypothetical protein